MGFRNVCGAPRWYLWRNKYSMAALLWCILRILTDFQSVTIDLPRWGRQQRLIRNVEKYSQLIPLEYVYKSPGFDVFLTRLKLMGKAPYVIFFDMSNLDVTLNHVCNLKYMPGTLERFAAVSFEKEAEEKFKKIHPDLATVTVDYSHVKTNVPKDIENSKYLTYQLILMLRARVVTALAESGIDHWAMQQDSLWTDNFAAMDIEDKHPHANLIFDSVGNDQYRVYQKMQGWICGATFFVRANRHTVEFFKLVTHIMTRRLSPDSTIMSYLCGSPHYKCVTLPRWIASNSNFFMGNRQPVPLIIQVDHSSALPKMELFRRWGWDFTTPSGTCNATAVMHLKQTAATGLPEVREAPDGPDDTPFPIKLAYAIRQFIGLDPFKRKSFLRVHEALI